MHTVNVYDAKTRLSELLDRVLAGEEVVIARHGRPVARLVPVEERRPRVPGALAHLRSKGAYDDSRFFEPMTEDELAEWEGGG
jgi:prevent-host-death family protein